jgi:minor curlin subunit
MIKILTVATIALTVALSTAHAQTAVPLNDSFVNQIGDYNSAAIEQMGGGNKQTTLQGQANAPSFNNTSNTTQTANPLTGSANSSTTIQTGPGSNLSNVIQVATAGGTNTQLTIQNGFANVASTMQIAHAGLANNSTIMQTGNHNTTTVVQK